MANQIDGGNLENRLETAKKAFIATATAAGVFLGFQYGVEGIQDFLYNLKEVEVIGNYFKDDLNRIGVSSVVSGTVGGTLGYFASKVATTREFTKSAVHTTGVAIGGLAGGILGFGFSNELLNFYEAAGDKATLSDFFYQMTQDILASALTGSLGALFGVKNIKRISQYNERAKS